MAVNRSNNNGRGSRPQAEIFRRLFPPSNVWLPFIIIVNRRVDSLISVMLRMKPFAAHGDFSVAYRYERNAVRGAMRRIWLQKKPPAGYHEYISIRILLTEWGAGGKRAALDIYRHQRHISSA